MTWVRMDSDETRDRWVNEQQALMAVQSVGYRYLSGQLWTLSFRFMVDELLHTSSSSKGEEVHSHERDVSASERERFGKHFLMHAGLSIP